MDTLALKRGVRLQKPADFKRVRRQGKSHAHPFVVLISRPNDVDQLRIGVSAGKRVGNAVQRNRAKRLLRAGIHRLLDGLQSGHDIILLAREAILQAKSQDVQKALEGLAKRAKLIK